MKKNIDKNESEPPDILTFNTPKGKMTLDIKEYQKYIDFENKNKL